MPITYRKRQKEMKRREKQRRKEERREQKKLANQAAREGGAPAQDGGVLGDVGFDDIDMMETAEQAAGLVEAPMPQFQPETSATTEQENDRQAPPPEPENR
jgi:hypothetical protein